MEKLAHVTFTIWDGVHRPYKQNKSHILRTRCRDDPTLTLRWEVGAEGNPRQSMGLPSRRILPSAVQHIG